MTTADEPYNPDDNESHDPDRSRHHDGFGVTDGFPDQEIIRPDVFHGFVDTRAIRLRLDALDTEAEDPDETFGAIITVLSYVPELLSEIERLYLLMRAERQRYANLRAACLAAFSAEMDGETDALSYVYDEFRNNPDHDGRNWGRR